MAPPPNRVFVIGLVLGLGFTAALVVMPFASFILMGLLAAYFIYPLYARAARRWGFPRVLAALFLVSLLVFVVAPFAYVAYVLVKEATAFVAAADPIAMRSGVQDGLARFFAALGLETPASIAALDLAQVLGPVKTAAAAVLPDVLSFVAKMLVGILVLLFVVYYGLIDGPKLVQYLKSVLPLSEAHTGHLFAEVRNVVEAVFFGQVVAAAAQAALAFVGFLVFGVPNPLFWAFVLGIFAVVPFLGSAIVWLPAVVFLLVTGPAVNGILLLAWSVILVANVDNVVKPYVIGGRTSLHPVLVLLGILGGLLAFGVIGFVIGPLVLALFTAVLNFWRDDYLPHYRSV